MIETLNSVEMVFRPLIFFFEVIGNFDVQVATPVDQLQSIERQLERSNQVAEKYLTLSHAEGGFQSHNSLELDRFMVSSRIVHTKNVITWVVDGRGILRSQLDRRVAIESLLDCQLLHLYAFSDKYVYWYASNCR